MLGSVSYYYTYNRIDTLVLKEPGKLVKDHQVINDHQQTYCFHFGGWW